MPARHLRKHQTVAERDLAGAAKQLRNATCLVHGRRLLISLLHCEQCRNRSETQVMPLDCPPPLTPPHKGGDGRRARESARLARWFTMLFRFADLAGPTHDRRCGASRSLPISVGSPVCGPQRGPSRHASLHHRRILIARRASSASMAEIAGLASLLTPRRGLSLVREPLCFRDECQETRGRRLARRAPLRRRGHRAHVSRFPACRSARASGRHLLGRRDAMLAVASRPCPAPANPSQGTRLAGPGADDRRVGVQHH